MRVSLTEVNGYPVLRCEDGSHFAIDWQAASLTHRLSRLSHEKLVSLLQLNKYPEPVVWDLTAGLGTDTVLLAAAGASVYATEQHPTVFALLKGAYDRLHAETAPPEWLSRIQLIHANSASLSATDYPAPDVVCVDPMFDHGNRRAKSKKGLDALQSLLGEPNDPTPLITHALTLGARRVIVKQARKANPPQQLPKPNFVVDLKACQYWVWDRVG